MIERAQLGKVGERKLGGVICFKIVYLSKLTFAVLFDPESLLLKRAG